MSPLAGAWREYIAAGRSFSRPARLFLLAEFALWMGYGIQTVLFNLYLAESGYREAFVGNALTALGAGLALAAIPAGILADRWGRRRCMMLGVVVEGLGLLGRPCLPGPGAILASCFVAGIGQSLFQIAALPFVTEHSSARERTHLFSVVFSAMLLAGVAGSAVAGALPAALLALPGGVRPGTLAAYRVTLVLAGLCSLTALLPLARLGGLREGAVAHSGARTPSGSLRLLFPIALNYVLIGCGAGLVIPFMNLYFKNRFACSSTQIGAFFSIAAVATALTALLAPALARRFGTLRTAFAFEILSLPFLVTLGAETRLTVAVASFWVRATLMQAATPLLNTFVMETLPSGLRARSASVNNLVWNIGWAVSATLAGVVIERWGYALPFYLTAGLYATAATTFYLAFRRRGPSAEEEPQGTFAAGVAGSAPFAD